MQSQPFGIDAATDAEWPTFQIPVSAEAVEFSQNRRLFDLGWFQSQRDRPVSQG
jgi:hypothetical protein